MQRVAGCGLGGGAGLLLLLLPMDSLVPWLLALMAGAWLGMLVQSGRHGVGVAATQAVVAFILTLVQGQGPPTSLEPALERLAGMLGALAMLLAAMLLFGPTPLQEGRPARQRRTGRSARLSGPVACYARGRAGAVSRRRVATCERTGRSCRMLHRPSSALRKRRAQPL